MNSIDVIQGFCECCNNQVPPEELYVDLFRNVYRYICHECFQRLYGSIKGEKIYYSKLLQIKPDLISYRTFKNHNKDVIVIANSFPFLNRANNFFSLMEIERLKKVAVNKFLGSEKINRKFKIITADYKTSEQVQPNNGVALIVSVVARVRFNNYLEFMEHEMYMLSRKELKTVVM